MHFFQTLKTINQLKKEYIAIHKTFNQMNDNEKYTADSLAVKISHHFNTYNQDIKEFKSMNLMADCAYALKNLSLHLTYYRFDENSIKEEHKDLLHLIAKKEELFIRHLQIKEELRKLNQIKFLANFYKRNKNLSEIEQARTLAKDTLIERHDDKNYIMQAIYSKNLQIEPIDYDYLEKAKDKLQKMRNAFVVTTKTPILKSDLEFEQ